VPYADQTPSEFESRGPGVESTERNCRKQLRKRVADRKYGFESRWDRLYDDANSTRTESCVAICPDPEAPVQVDALKAADHNG